MLEIILTLGSRSRRVGARELVAAVAMAPEVATLVRLLLSTTPVQDVHSREGVGDVKGSLQSVENANAFNSIAFRRSDPDRPEGDADARELADERAGYLAEALDDHRSHAWYRRVVLSVPESVIRDALMRARDLPTKNVRRSRAALFTSIVRPHLKPYAHPPSTSS